MRLIRTAWQQNSRLCASDHLQKVFFLRIFAELQLAQHLQDQEMEANVNWETASSSNREPVAPHSNKHAENYRAGEGFHSESLSVSCNQQLRR